VKKIFIGVLLVVCGLGAGFSSVFAFARVARDEKYIAHSLEWAAEKRAEEPTLMPGETGVGSSYDQIQAKADGYLADAEEAVADKEMQMILAWSLVAGGVILVGIAVLLFVSAARTRRGWFMGALPVEEGTGPRAGCCRALAVLLGALPEPCPLP